MTHRARRRCACSRGSSPPSTTAVRPGARCRAACASSTLLLGGGLDRGTSTLMHRARRRRQVRASPRSTRYAAAEPRRRASRCSRSTRRTSTLDLPRRARSAWTSIATLRAGARSRCSRSIRPRCRRASSCTPSAPLSRSDGVRLLVVDSLNGYLHAMPEEQLPAPPAPRAADATCASAASRWSWCVAQHWSR